MIIIIFCVNIFHRRESETIFSEGASFAVQ